MCVCRGFWKVGLPPVINKAGTLDGERGGCAFDSQVPTLSPLRTSDGDFQSKVRVVNAEPWRAGVGGGRGLADSPPCQHPSESPGVTWEQGETREIQRRRAKGEWVPSMSSPGPHPPPPPPCVWMQMRDPGGPGRLLLTTGPPERSGARKSNKKGNFGLLIFLQSGYISK